MLRYLAKSALLIGISVVVVCGVYPGVLWVIGQTLFPFQTNGSIVRSDDGKAIGSLLVAQPFTKDEYFQPRPSAASYDATASTSSGYAPSNYALRDRVARVLGPIVTYASGDKKGQPVAPDVEAWFKADKAGGNPHIVAQWADAHNSLAQAWVPSDPTHGAYVDAWTKAHDDAVKEWIKKNPATPEPKASDLAVLFFENFSNDHPGMLHRRMRREADCIAVLDLDADYLPRPFSAQDLAARVRVAELRRFNASVPRRYYRHGSFVIDLFNRRAALEGERIALARSEMSVLTLLASRAGDVATFGRILAGLGRADSASGRRALRASVFRLRRKIERDPRRPDLLLTEAGVGYRLASETEGELGLDPPAPQRAGNEDASS